MKPEALQFKTAKKILVIILLSLSTSLVFCQLSGTYTIGDAQDYPDIASAIAVLHSDGINGPVVFNIIPGTYLVHVTMNQITGGSATNTITFQSSTQNSSDVILQHYPTGIDDNWIFLLDGPDYLNFNHLTFTVKGESLYGTVFRFDGFTSNISFNNNAFLGKYSGGGATARETIIHADVEYHLEQYYMNLHFKDNYFFRGSYAIFLEGYNDNFIVGSIVDGNIFEETGYCCTYCNFNYAPVVTNNIMEAASYGIRVNGDHGGGTYSSNKIYSEHTGMSIQRYGEGAGRSLISNNFVTIGSNGDYGITIVNSVLTDVLNNSVNCLSNSWDAAAFYCGYAVNQTPTVTVKNNNFSCEYKSYPIFVGTENVISDMSNNNLYTAGNYIANWLSHKVFDIKELQDLSGMNNNSLSVYPHYISDTDLHTIAPWLDGKGTTVALVTDDIDGDNRTGSPDIGADEFTPDPSTTTPLDGSLEYTIGTGGIYPDFETAMADALLKGISAPVTFGFQDGTYEDQFIIKSIPGSGDDKRVTIQSATGNTNFAHLTYTADDFYENFVFKFHGADFITLRNLKLSATGSQYAIVIDLYQGADSIIIENDSLITTGSTSAKENLTNIFSGDSDFRSRIIRQNQIIDGAYAIYMRRDQNNFLYPKGAVIENNNFSNIGYSAMYLQFYESPKIIGNTIEARSKGIQALSCSKDLRIQKNKINMSSGDGIYLSTCDGNEDHLGLISNNFIHCAGNTGRSGIYINNSPYQTIFNNSVHVTNTYITSRPLYISSGGSTSTTLLNNIFSNTGGGSAMYIYTPSTIVNCDYNLYYSMHDYLVYWGENVTDLESLRVLNSMDEHSVNGNPHFISDTDLHSFAEILDSAGLSLTEVPDDIDGESRNLNYPDIGADEFIIGLNQPPYVDKAIPDQEFAWNMALRDIAFLDTVFIDPDPGDILVYTAQSSNPGVLAKIEDKVLQLASGEGFSGTSEITVTATDLQDASVEDVFTVEFYEVIENHPPVAVDDTVFTHEALTIEVLQNDYDEDGDDIIISGYEYNGSANLTLSNDSKAIHYVPIYLADSPDTIQYFIQDSHGASDTAMVFIHLYRLMGGLNLIDTDLEGLSHGTIKWGDYDDDGDLDLLQTGWTGTSLEFRTKIITNKGENEFEDSGIQFIGVSAGTSSSAAWVDFDNDNDLDICVSGRMDGEAEIYKVLLYENEGGSFSLYTNFEFTGTTSSSMCWGDINMDGKKDLIITGAVGMSQDTWIYLGKGDNGSGWVFEMTQPEIPGAQNGEVSLIDIDMDGDLDFFICGGNIGVSRIYLQKEDGIEEIESGIPDFTNASMDWADFDYDGDPDLAIMGRSNDVYKCQIYENVGLGKKNGAVLILYQDFEGMEGGDIAWSDFNNSGEMDIIVTGNDDILHSVTKILLNDDGVFTEENFSLAGLGRSSLAWGDYDNDGDLDLALQGIDMTNSQTLIYINDGVQGNTPPEIADNLNTDKSGHYYTLSWEPGTDDDTPQPGLSYNVRFGTTAAGTDIISPMAVNGFLKTPQVGNAGNNTFIKLTDLEPGEYYWSVQAIDQSFAASGFTMPAYLVITGLLDDETKTNLKIFPNPANDRIWINAMECGDYQLHIFELTGKEMLSRNISLNKDNPYEIVVNQLNPGIYIVQINNGIKTKFMKLIIQ